MVTQCPICRRWFLIASEQTEAAHGLARCGDCDTVFNALATLRERAPTGERPDKTAAVIPDSGREAASEPDSAMPEGGRGEVPLPLEFRPLPRARHPSRWLWAAALVVAVLVLAAQLINANRHAIAHTPVAGSALRAIYRGFGAPLEARLILARYAIADAALTGAHDASGALRLDGRLVNRAAFAQRLPLIELSLRNRRGEAVGSRLLLPSDYAAATISTVAAGGEMRFHARIADPGAEATGFTLVLCKRRAKRVVCGSS